jgi:hypothetical protein
MRHFPLWFAVPLLATGIGAVSAEDLPGKSPVSSGIIHSSPETPDRPPIDPAIGRAWSTNPSTVDLLHQPSVGGRDPLGGDPSRPGDQGSQARRQ